MQTLIENAIPLGVGGVIALVAFLLGKVGVTVPKEWAGPLKSAAHTAARGYANARMSEGMTRADAARVTTAHVRDYLRETFAETIRKHGPNIDVLAQGVTDEALAERDLATLQGGKR